MTTLRLSTTTSRSRLAAKPRTSSLNSSSATVLARASSQNSTLLGGNSGEGGPPTRSTMLVCSSGSTIRSEPFGNSAMPLPDKLQPRPSHLISSHSSSPRRLSNSNGFVRYMDHPCSVAVANVELGDPAELKLTPSTDLRGSSPIV